MFRIKTLDVKCHNSTIFTSVQIRKNRTTSNVVQVTFHFSCSFSHFHVTSWPLSSALLFPSVCRFVCPMFVCMFVRWNGCLYECVRVRMHVCVCVCTYMCFVSKIKQLRSLFCPLEIAPIYWQMTIFNGADFHKRVKLELLADTDGLILFKHLFTTLLQSFPTRLRLFLLF